MSSSKIPSDQDPLVLSFGYEHWVKAESLEQDPSSSIDDLAQSALRASASVHPDQQRSRAKASEALHQQPPVSAFGVWAQVKGSAAQDAAPSDRDLLEMSFGCEHWVKAESSEQDQDFPQVTVTDRPPVSRPTAQGAPPATTTTLDPDAPYQQPPASGVWAQVNETFAQALPPATTTEQYYPPVTISFVSPSLGQNARCQQLSASGERTPKSQTTAQALPPATTTEQYYPPVTLTTYPPRLPAEYLAGLDPQQRAWAQLEEKTKSFPFEYIEGLRLQRFDNIWCPQQSAVKVAGEHIIHANWVKLDGSRKKFIASQAPRSDDMGLFWKLALDRSVEMSIVDLSNASDRKFDKSRECVKEYCPLKLNESKTYTYDPGKKITVTLIDEKTVGQGKMYTYNVSENPPGGVKVTRPVVRYHFPTWPDGGDLPLNTFKEILSIVESPDFRQGTTLVHCRAGVGRTGCVITAIFLKEKILSGEINRDNFLEELQKLILELRMQRGPSFVQRKEQFELPL